jgi:uncharacterized membrane protein YtjA (UPF0391 family)
MLGWALTFFIIAIVSGILGFGGLTAAAAGAAQFFFWIFVALFILSVAAASRAGKRGAR